MSRPAVPLVSLKRDLRLGDHAPLVVRFGAVVEVLAELSRRIRIPLEWLHTPWLMPAARRSGGARDESRVILKRQGSRKRPRPQRPAPAAADLFADER